jgi:copper chaperone
MPMPPGKQTFAVTGLHCQNCVRHVTEALQALPGVREVLVDLDPDGASAVTVEADRPLDAGEVAAALADEGDYALVAQP